MGQSRACSPSKAPPQQNSCGLWSQSSNPPLGPPLGHRAGCCLWMSPLPPPFPAQSPGREICSNPYPPPSRPDPPGSCFYACTGHIWRADCSYRATSHYNGPPWGRSTCTPPPSRRSAGAGKAAPQRGETPGVELPLLHLTWLYLAPPPRNQPILLPL